MSFHVDYLLSEVFMAMMRHWYVARVMIPLGFVCAPWIRFLPAYPRWHVVEESKPTHPDPGSSLIWAAS